MKPKTSERMQSHMTKRAISTGLLAAAMLTAAVLTGAPALGQEAVVAGEAVETVAATSPEVAFILNSLLFLMGGFLVFFMAAGFAMLEAGLVRSKNVTMQLMKNVALFALAAIFYYLIGYNLMYPLGSWSLGSDETGGYLGAFGVAVLEAVGIGSEQADDISYAATGSDFFFQLMFCAATASIVSGALAERIKLWPFLLFTIVLTGIIYPVQASWKWGGGFLDSQWGFQDFAGSTVVHSVGGWAALAGAIVLGPRLGKYRDGRVNPFPGSNLALATLGMFILWLGWFGFNGGSQLAMGTVGDVADVSRIFANTNAAAAGGAVAALIATQLVYGKPDLTMILNGALAGLVSITAEPLMPGLGAATLIGSQLAYGKPDLTMVLNGALAGLVSITAEPLMPTLGGALLIGGVGGLIVTFTVPLLDKARIDDVVGAIPVHLFAGIWGTIAVVFSNPNSTFLAQLVSIVIVGVFAFVVSLLVWLVLRAILGIRVSEEAEVVGLDVGELGMEAYPEFAKG